LSYYRVRDIRKEMYMSFHTCARFTIYQYRRAYNKMVEDITTKDDSDTEIGRRVCREVDRFVGWLMEMYHLT